jgi:hypothetical protein
MMMTFKIEAQKRLGGRTFVRTEATTDNASHTFTREYALSPKKAIMASLARVMKALWGASHGPTSISESEATGEAIRTEGGRLEYVR